MASYALQFGFNLGVRRQKGIPGMGGEKLVLLSFAVGASIVALASFLPLPGAEYVLWPGQIFAGLFWPEGIHSGNGGLETAGAFLLVTWAAALTFWAALFFAVVSVAHKTWAA